MTRIGLFGGTFDPVHYGHLRPALELAEYYELDTLNLLPNQRPQHRGAPRASTEQRIQMLNKAVSGVTQLAVDAREADRDEPTYTIDTLNEVHNENPNATLVFFMGMDAFAQFDSWHRWEDILTVANLVVVDRPDSVPSDFAKSLVARQISAVGKAIVAGSCGVIERFEVTQLSISATDIRRRVGERRSVQFLLPEVVREYILEKRLYH